MSLIISLERHFLSDDCQPPFISRFSADETVIEVGESTTLRWAVAGTTTDVRLDSAAVAATGLRRVSPTSSQTYRLTAENVCLSSSDTVTVCVNPLQTTPTLTSVHRRLPIITDQAPIPYFSRLL